MSGFFPPWEITSVRADCLVELRSTERLLNTPGMVGGASSQLIGDAA